VINWLYLAESISLKSFTWSSPQHLGPLGPPGPAMYAAKVSLLQQVSSHGHTGRELLGFATSAIDLPIHQLYITYMHVIYKYYYTYHGKKKFIVILYKDVTMTIHISMQPAFFPFLTWLSGDIWSMILRLAELWAPSSSYAELLFFRSSWAFFFGWDALRDRWRRQTWKNWTLQALHGDCHGVSW